MTLFRCAASGVFASGRTWSFRQHFSSTHTQAQVETDWLAQIISFWTNGSHGVETIYPTGTVLQVTSTAQLTSLLREGVKSEDAPALAGTSVNDSLPEQNCILISLRTAMVGRGNRGRIHLPAPAESEATGGELGSTQATRVSTAIHALYTNMAAAGHTPVIFNVHATAHDPVVGTTKDVTELLVDRVLRTQRGRVRKSLAVYV